MPAATFDLPTFPAQSWTAFWPRDSVTTTANVTLLLKSHAKPPGHTCGLRLCDGFPGETGSSSLDAASVDFLMSGDPCRPTYCLNGPTSINVYGASSSLE